MTSRYRQRRPVSSLRRLWRWCLSAVLLIGVAIIALVVLLRFVDPPSSAFILRARLDASLSAVDHRWVADACLPDPARLAVIAAEDQRFPGHFGFDLEQIADVLAASEQGGVMRGASTLTQQTAKNLFLWPGRNWLRKALEAGLTVLLEAIWPKRRILEVYLNVAEFGPGVFGLEAAAQRFFGKPAVALGPAESALLAAVLPNPAVLDVTAPSAYVRQRQAWIMRQMRQVRGLPGMAELLAAAGRCPANGSPRRTG